MKNSFHMILICFMIITSTFFDAYSQAYTCPDGTLSTVKTILVNGCTIDLHVCYNCNVTRPNDIYVMGYFKPNDSCNVGDQQIWNAIYSLTQSANFLYELCGAPGPCDQPSEIRNYRLIYSKCAKKVWSSNGIWEIACMFDCICIVNKTLCWNESEQRYETGNGTPATETYCPQQNPCDLPIQPDPTEQNPETDCFTIQTPCG